MTVEGAAEESVEGGEGAMEADTFGIAFTWVARDRLRGDIRVVIDESQTVLSAMASVRTN